MQQNNTHYNLQSHIMREEMPLWFIIYFLSVNWLYSINMLQTRFLYDL